MLRTTIRLKASAEANASGNLSGVSLR